MKIIICAKVVLDPEAPASLFQVDSEAKKVIPPRGTPPVLNPFDENALEAALKIKDSKGASITILSMGRSIPKAVIRKSLATGVDNLILLEDEIFEDLDTYATASILAKAIQKINDFDLVLCGREAADTDAGQVGLGIAEMLGLPSISLAGNIEAGDNKIKVQRVLADGREIVETPLPAVVTVSSEVGLLRTATLPNIMAAQKKPMTIWTSRDLGIDPAQITKRVALSSLYKPVINRKCEIITGSTPEEAAVKLAVNLKENKLI